MSQYLELADWLLWAASIVAQVYVAVRAKHFPKFRAFLVYLSLSDVMLVTVALRYSPETYASAYYVLLVPRLWLILHCLSEVFERVFRPYRTMPKLSLPAVLMGLCFIPTAAGISVFGLVLKTGISTARVLRGLEIGVYVSAFLGFTFLLVFAEFFGISLRDRLAAIAAGFAVILGAQVFVQAFGTFHSAEVNAWLRRIQALIVLSGEAVWLFRFQNKSELPPKLSPKSAAEMLRTVKRLTA